jgi:hypothetical protein
LAKLKESIQNTLKKFKKHEESELPGESEDDEDNSNSHQFDSNDDDNDSDDEDDKREDDCLTGSVNSSDIESLDSNPESPPFQDLVKALNHNYRRRMVRLVQYLKKKVEEPDVSENEFGD